VEAEQILVAVPTRGQVGWATCTRLQEIRDANPGLPPILYRPGHLSVALTRNHIVRAFMEGDWEALIMVDDDVAPASTLLSLVDGFGQYDVVAMPTFVWRPELAPTPVPAVWGMSNLQTPGGNGLGLRSAELVGTGCIAIHRRVFEGLPGEPFMVGHEEGHDVSDDIMFCRAVATAGFRIGADFRTGADHHTTISLQSVVMSMQAHSQPAGRK
jgi:hypothetical protein